MKASMWARSGAAALALCAAAVQADDLRLNGWAYGSSSGYTITGVSGQVGAGGYLTQFGGASFVSYCVDVHHGIAFNTTYGDYSATTLNAGASLLSSQVREFVGRFYGQVDTAIESSAFQLGLWELVEETGSGYGLGSGSFSASGNASAVGLANSWLGSLNGSTGTLYAYSLLTDSAGPDTQNLLAVSPIPEPSTYALMLAGLLGVGFAVRRRTG